MGWSWGFGHMPYGLFSVHAFLRQIVQRKLMTNELEGKEWKIHRRMFYRQFQQSIVHIHWPVQRTEAHSLLRRVLHSPQDLIKHFRQSVFFFFYRMSLICSHIDHLAAHWVSSNAASFIMNLTYGIHIASREDRYITIAEKALAGVSEAAKPGEFLVDLLPFCTHHLVLHR
jgi:hypothetical protein